MTGWRNLDFLIDLIRVRPFRFFLACLTLYWATCIFGY